MTVTVYVLDNKDPESGQIVTFRADGSRKEVIAELNGFADGIDISADGKTIYWSSMGLPTDVSTSAYGNLDGTINKLTLSNSKWSNQVIAEGSFFTPKQVCLNGDHLYFSDREGLGVYRVSTTSFKLEQLLVTGDPKTQMYDYPRQNVGCYVKNNYLYFTQKGPPKGGIGKILRIPINADISNPAKRSDVEILIDNLPEPIDIMFGPQTGKVYWTDRGAPPNGNSINSGELVGNKIINHRVITTGFNETIGVAIQSDEKTAFVTDINGQAYAVDLDTGKYTVIYKGGHLTGIQLVEDSA